MTNIGSVGIRAAPQYYRLDNGNIDTVRRVRLRDCSASAFAEATADKSAERARLAPAGFEPQARRGVTDGVLWQATSRSGLAVPPAQQRGSRTDDERADPVSAGPAFVSTGVVVSASCRLRCACESRRPTHCAARAGR